MLLNCDAGEESWGSLGLQGDQTSQTSKYSGNQPWIFTERTDAEAEAEAPILWPPDESQLTGKDPVLAKIKGRRRSEMREDEMVRWHYWFNGWIWANFGRWWRTEEPGMLQSLGSQRAGHDLVTEKQQQQQKDLICPPPGKAADSQTNKLQSVTLGPTRWEGLVRTLRSCLA